MAITVPMQPLFPAATPLPRSYMVTIWVPRGEEVALRPDGFGSAPGTTCATVCAGERYTVTARAVNETEAVRIAREAVLEGLGWDACLSGARWEVREA